MRIIRLEIQNFRAFYGKHVVELAKDGERGKQNLLVYGENGSGKSSLLLAIQYFLDSSNHFQDFNNYQHFKKKDDLGYIETHLRERLNTPKKVCKWSSIPEETNTDDRDLNEASQAKGILDYKKLLEVHFVHRNESNINIFDLLVNNLLAKCINDSDIYLRTFSEQWNHLLTIIPKRRNNTRQLEEFRKEAALFNLGLRAKLNELEGKIASLMNYFGYQVNISFGFENGIDFNEDLAIKYSKDRKENSIKDREIFLNVEFLGEIVPSPHQFLNEAKLTAIAIAIYFGSLLIAPKPKLKLLVLDDIFIGLDMSNRLPLIDILKEKFSDYQIFLMTYDREWYEILKQRLDSRTWLFQELYRGVIEDDLEIPIWKQDKDYLEKAVDYLSNHELKASAVYLRNAFEVILKQFCNANKVKITYKEESKKLTSDDFWQEVKKAKKTNGTLYVNQLLAFDVELYRNIIMNPLSHSRITGVFRQEIVDAIATIEKLKLALFPNNK